MFAIERVINLDMLLVLGEVSRNLRVGPEIREIVEALMPCLGTEGDCQLTQMSSDFFYEGGTCYAKGLKLACGVTSCLPNRLSILLLSSVSLRRGLTFAV